MSISRNCKLTLVVMLSMAVLSVEAATFTVSKPGGGGQFTSVQAAINKAGPGDIVKIIDNGVYAEQVTIDSTKNGLTLTSSNPTSINKPKIVWQDKVNVGPKTCTEAKVESNVTFDRNGALQLLRVTNVIIEGIAVDGGGAYPFGYDRVWSTDAGCSQGTCNGGPCAMFHGNGGIAIWISGNVTVRNCNISNAYYGFNVKDRNEGGVFGNPNPGDNSPWNVVPLSGFGKTGNHLIEHNRIHNNSYGLFFESSWDLGSTIRYNLIYNNYHQTDVIANQVVKLPDGTNEGGGAIKLKDDMLSPLAIYNNTFWHNHMIFFAHWQVGAQHLVFNNIFGSPYVYWDKVTVEIVKNTHYMELFTKFVNRMKNCVIAAQMQAPVGPPYNSVQVLNGLQVPNVGGFILPGSLITNTPAYPVDAEVRWLETPFMSTDTASNNFLVPDWNDTLVKAFIRNKGCVATGVKNPDGTIADLGAIPFSGNQTSVAIITPTVPVQITGTTALVTFNLSEQVGSMKNPKIVYFRFIKNVEFLPATNYWSADKAPVIPASAIIDIAIPTKPVVVGANSFSVTIPARLASENYAFFEIIIEGTGTDGKTVNSTVGFIPYRKLDYKFVVQVWDLGKTKQLTQVGVGDTVWLRLIPQKIDGQLFLNKLDTVDVRLQSGFDLLVPGNPPVKAVYPGGFTGQNDKAVIFTKVPPGGFEYVIASGLWTNGANKVPFLGASEGIKIVAGLPEKVVFQNPPSNSFGANPPRVDPGPPFAGSLYVYDKYGNRVEKAATITLSSLTPTVGDISGPKTITTDATGTGVFGIEIVKGTENQIFTIIGTLAGKNTDSADVIVGKARDRLWIFYSDTALYAPLTATIQGQVGDRVKITVMAGKSARLDSITKISSTFTINGSTGLQFYSSQAAPTSSTSFTLTDGRVDIWVTSLVEVNNGSVTAVSDTNLILSSDSRSNIFFIKPLIAIDSAFYYADNGFGRVSRVEVYYKDTMAMAPDSMVFFWPERTAANKQLVTGTGTAIVMDPNKKHLTITLPAPFPAEVTFNSGIGQLGTTYQKVTVGATDNDTSRFVIKERVGPLVMTAAVVERLAAGVDTLFVTFSESLKAGSLVGASLILIQNGTPSVLTVAAAVLNGTTWKLTLTAGSTQPLLGDSLRINPAGPLADALGNTAHLQNRPVSLSMRGIPASITASSYFDRNADGTVETVVMKFNKKVTLADCVIKLDWGGNNTTDTIDVTRLSFAGTDNMTLEINVAGLFTLITAPKTSGDMNATVGYHSIPDVSVGHAVADSAAPVLTLAVYHPGKSSKTEKVSDTLWLDFSEPLGTLQNSLTFLLNSSSANTPYSIVVNTTTLSSSGTHRSFLVTSINGVTFPSKGDSIRIDPASRISDILNSIQLNDNNRRVVLDVLPVPYDIDVEISANPFTPGKTFTFDGINATGIVIEVAPNTPVMENIAISATGRLYDAMGNLIMDKTLFQKNMTNNKLYLIWDGRNRNGRYVGTGTYLALVSWIKDNKISVTEKIKIGVKR